MSALRHVAIGDPQAPLTTVLEILDGQGLLANDGRLANDVRLTSIGDHFDWGHVRDRARATTDALALLSWLSSHDPEQVVLIAGNHDLARVCELSNFADDATYEQARREADGLYRPHVPATREALDAFATRWPFVPDVEALARDLSCFSLEQRRLVELLLREGRFRLAHAHGAHLLVHAGITLDDLAVLNLEPAPPFELAAALNEFFDASIHAWAQGPLSLAPVHQPGTQHTGPMRGLFSHRPADPTATGAVAEDFEGSARRRFDPRRLPPSLTQVIGHIRDDKCRALMPNWVQGAPAGDGRLRSLVVTEHGTVQYFGHVAPSPQLIFIDGGMLSTPTERYELLDLDTGQPFISRRTAR